MKVSVDIVLYKIIDNTLCVLITKRKKAPYIGQWCLPWGFIMWDETIEDAAKRVLLKETGISHNFLEQVCVFSNPQRDPRWRAIGVSFLGILQEDVVIHIWSTQEQVLRCPINQLPNLVFDHNEITTYIYNYLIKNIIHNSYAQFFLPHYFTMRQLQNIYEIILHRKYEKRNFHKFIQNKHNYKATKRFEYWKAHRPARLYVLST